jgi:hypothetical protein
MEDAANTCKGSSAGPIQLAGDQTFSFFIPTLFRNPARCNVLVLKSEYQPVFPLAQRTICAMVLKRKVSAEREVMAIGTMCGRTATFLSCSAMLAANKL